MSNSPDKVFTRHTTDGQRRCDTRNKIENLLTLAAANRPMMGKASSALPHLIKARDLLVELIAEIESGGS